MNQTQNTNPCDLAVCVDMSNEFNYGNLGSPEAAEKVPYIVRFLADFNGQRAFTLDTHKPDYLHTQEGRNLPIIHGQKDTPEWRLVQPIAGILRPDDIIIEKDTFGSDKLFEYIRTHKFRRIYFMGRCTGVCVIACAVMAKTADPEAEIYILSDLCSCVSEKSHQTALDAMQMLQMKIITREDM